MACAPITEYVVSESNRILPGEIYSRTIPRSPWMVLQDRGEYPEELGYDPITVLTYERTLPEEANPTWHDVAITGLLDGQEGGACNPPFSTIQFGSTPRTFNLQEYVVHTPDFCAVNLRTAFQLKMQLSRIYDNMGLFARTIWEFRDRHEYLKSCYYKVVCDVPTTFDNTEGQDFNDISDGSNFNTAISVLTQGILNRWRMTLLRDGASEGSNGTVDGEPQLDLITDAETSENLFFLNGDNRSDLRYGDPHKLLKTYGVGGPYKGFYHIIDPYPIRGNISQGIFTEVPPFIKTDASKGKRGDPNPAWASAGYTVSFIHNRKVNQQLIPRPITAPHPEFKFDPVNYTGTWLAHNIIDRTCNIDGNQIFFRGHFMSGTMPVHPEYGVAFLHKNCPAPLGLVTTCPTS